MALAPEDTRRALQAVRDAAVTDATNVARRNAQPSHLRSALLAVVPRLTGYYVDGSSALAVDWYVELREESRPRRRFAVAPADWRREEKFGRAVAWATEPLTLEQPDVDEMVRRLAPVVDYEVQHGFTETITDNTARDPAAAGWKRQTRFDACPFCRMLADRGAVYRERSARFAAHTNCHCTAVPVFGEGDVGPEADVEQYRASRRRTTAADRARLREYLKANYGGT